MLWPENAYYYEFCKGGKTGYTDQSKTTLVTMADNGSLQLAAVVLYDYGVDAYTDTREMFDYVFNNFKRVPVGEQSGDIAKAAETEKPASGAEDPAAPQSGDIASFEKQDAYVVLPEGVDISQADRRITLTEDGIRTGKIQYTYKGQSVGSADVTLTEEGYQRLTGGDVAKSDSKKIENGDKVPQKDAAEQEGQDGKKLGSEMIKLIIGVSAAVVFVAIVLIALLSKRRKRKRRR